MSAPNIKAIAEPLDLSRYRFDHGNYFPSFEEFNFRADGIVMSIMLPGFKPDADQIREEIEESKFPNCHHAAMWNAKCMVTFSIHSARLFHEAADAESRHIETWQSLTKLEEHHRCYGNVYTLKWAKILFDAVQDMIGPTTRILTKLNPQHVEDRFCEIYACCQAKTYEFVRDHPRQPGEGLIPCLFDFYAKWHGLKTEPTMEKDFCSYSLYCKAMDPEREAPLSLMGECVSIARLRLVRPEAGEVLEAGEIPEDEEMSEAEEEE